MKIFQKFLKNNPKKKQTNKDTNFSLITVASPISTLSTTSQLFFPAFVSYCESTAGVY